MDDLLARVDAAFAVTGADTPGWPDPHPDGAGPAEEEYSRVTDPGRYRILDGRVEAWSQVLAAEGLVSVEDVARPPLNPHGEVERVRRFSPAAPGAAALIVSTRTIDGQPFLDLGVELADVPVGVVAGLPHCGCDACDDGSDRLLCELDDVVLTVAAGGVLHAEGPDGSSITRERSGWSAHGQADERWLDAATEAPAGVRRWIGVPWRRDRNGPRS